jgi:hypothetical protein
MNLSERSVNKLRASPERSEGEDQFSGERPKGVRRKIVIYAQCINANKKSI